MIQRCVLAEPLKLKLQFLTITSLENLDGCTSVHLRMKKTKKLVDHQTGVKRTEQARTCVVALD